MVIFLAQSMGRGAASPLSSARLPAEKELRAVLRTLTIDPEAKPEPSSSVACLPLVLRKSLQAFNGKERSICPFGVGQGQMSGQRGAFVTCFELSWGYAPMHRTNGSTCSLPYCQG